MSEELKGPTTAALGPGGEPQRGTGGGLGPGKSKAVPAARDGSAVRPGHAFGDRPKRGVLITLALICLLGFGLRVHRAINPVVDPGIDAVTYGSIARSLYVDHRYGNGPEASDWSPGAPLLYAGVYYASGGEHPKLARLVVALLGLATILVCFLLARRLAGDGAGLLAALGVAVYPAFIYDSGRLMSEPPAMLALVAAILSFVWASDRSARDPAAPPWIWALPGLLFGATALIRPEYLLISVVFGIVAVLWLRRRGRPRRQSALALGAMALAFLVPILPWTVRNLITLDRVVPISTGGGKALFIGTYLPGDGNHFKTKVALYREFHPRTSRTDTELLGVAPRPLFDRVAARYPGLSRDAALGRAGRHNLSKYLFGQPIDFAAMMARKVRHMWGPSGRSMRGTAANLLHYALLALGIAGLAMLARRQRWEALVMGLPIGLITVISAFLLAGTRRNVPLMPLVIVLAACACAWLYSLAFRGSRRPSS